VFGVPPQTFFKRCPYMAVLGWLYEQAADPLSAKPQKTKFGLQP